MAYKPSFGTSSDTNGDGGDIDGAASSAGFLFDGGAAGDSGDGSGGSERDARGDEFDPDIHISRDKRNADGSYRRKRAKRGSGNSASTGGRKKANNQAGVEGLTRMLAIIHIGLAGATKTPELKLEDEEAEALAKSTAVVLEEFDIRPDPKIEAIIGLVTTASMIYGPRAYMITERKKREAVERAQQNEAYG